MADLTPDDITKQRFRTSFRGLDPVEVRQYLQSLASAVGELVSERDEMASRLSELGERDLKSEFESIGREVSAVLEAARDAADQLRQRATNDATRWRSEAVAEAEQGLRRARSDAEQLRADAWATADELLKQVTAEAERIEVNTEKERLRMVGEAERESHRVIGAGRREAEELIRNAKMEADRLTLSAQASHDELIEKATRQADAAQERTRALEIRRQELKVELDSIRHALATVEGELEERRSALQLSPQTVEEPTLPEPVVDDGDGSEKPGEEWTPGETVRVVRPGGGSPAARTTVGGPISDTPEIVVLTPEEVRARQESDAASTEMLEADEVAHAEPEPRPDDLSPEAESEQESDGPEAGTGPESEEIEAEEIEAEEIEAESPELSELGAAPDADDTSEVDDAPETLEADEDTGRFEELSGLFARLREPQTAAPVVHDEAAETEAAPARPESRAEKPRSRFEGDPFDLRARLLLPVSNRALRNIKRQLTEAQNEALDELRLSDGAWEPDGPSLGARLRPDLVVLASEAFASGHVAAMEMAGERFKRPPTPKTEPETEWVAALLSDLNHSLDEGRKLQQGARQLGASVSRVFRAWRTDEAERRVAELASERYHAGLAEVLASNGAAVEWVVSGRGCATCRTNTESETDEWESLPPAHANCGCTLVPG